MALILASENFVILQIEPCRGRSGAAARTGTLCETGKNRGLRGQRQVILVDYAPAKRRRMSNYTQKSTPRFSIKWIQPLTVLDSFTGSQFSGRTQPVLRMAE
jgi:hypothetical protein